METKTCTKCKQEKPRTKQYFNSHPHTKDKLHSWCKPCKLQNNKEFYKTTKGKKITQKWYEKVKGVYGIFENGVCLYVGESGRINHRISVHKCCINNPSSARKKVQYLYYHLQNHSNVIFGVIEETDNHKEREKFWINKLNPLYNAKQ